MPKTAPHSAATESQPKVCRECGEPATGAFCKPPADCKKIWHNRRMKRGAILYDLMMSMRFDRQAATDDNVWTLACRQMADWQREDETERAGRKSWRGHKSVLAERPQLKAHIGHIAIGRPPL